MQAVARARVNIKGEHLNCYEDSGIEKCVTHSSCQYCQRVNVSAVNYELEECLPDFLCFLTQGKDSILALSNEDKEHQLIGFVRGHC